MLPGPRHAQPGGQTPRDSPDLTVVSSDVLLVFHARVVMHGAETLKFQVEEFACGTVEGDHGAAGCIW